MNGALLEEDKGYTAMIKFIAASDAKALGVVVSLELAGQPIGKRAFRG